MPKPQQSSAALAEGTPAGALPAGAAGAGARGRYGLAGVGLAIVFLASLWAGNEDGLWLPGLGLSLALVAWLGHGIVPLLALDILAAQLVSGANPSVLALAGDSLLLAAEAGISWWLYACAAHGTRRPEDPRSAAVFLLLVPGAVAAAAAAFQAILWGWLGGPADDFLKGVSALWISRALGILALAPPLLVAVTPYLVRLGLTHREPSRKIPGGAEPQDWSWGEIIETGGLCVGAGVLAVVLVCQHVQQGLAGWPLWGISLLLVVWAGVRQGLRGGSLVAATSAILALSLAGYLEVSAGEFTPLQGNLLAQCTTALLVGASAGWLRASEARYRQMVGHMPVVLYSARLPRCVKAESHSAGARAEQALAPSPPRSGSHKISGGRLLVLRAEVTLVSPACRTVFNSPPEALLGPYAAWLERIDAADREVVLAALNQLFLQKQPVTCEYRVSLPATTGQAAPAVRWVRDTMVAYYAHEQSALSGWEGVIEDISEQRLLAQNLRRTHGMLQALVACLPTGVFFVQGPIGQPILVNQRARQLLGKREDLAAGIGHLTDVYRLHRPDGSPYPVEELPVARALRQGTTSMANDIVVHRADGRRTRLITWAAPVDATGTGNPDAAVWVLEDLAAMRPALAQETGATRPAQTAGFEKDGTNDGDTAAPYRRCAPADITSRAQGEELERAQRLELIGKLASGAIHDFNNLLTVMLGFAGLARSRLPGDHPAEQDLQQLVEAGDQAAQLAAQMLAFTKQTSQATKPTPQALDLNALVTHALKLLKGTMPSTIELAMHLSSEPLFVEGDETQLKQVVMNLCLNAREAMEKGGTLTIYTEKVFDEQAPERGSAQLIVEDTGSGIDPALKERIFEPFFTTKKHGTGLGLAVVRQILDSIGGRIKVANAAGQGTRMEVLLPGASQGSEIRRQESGVKSQSPNP